MADEPTNIKDALEMSLSRLTEEEDKEIIDRLYIYPSPNLAYLKSGWRRGQFATMGAEPEAVPFDQVRAIIAQPETYFYRMVEAMNALASLHGAQNQWDKVKADYARILEFSQAHRDSFPHLSAEATAAAFYNLAIIYRSEENFAEAENYLNQSIEIYRLLFENAGSAPPENLKADQFFTSEQRQRLAELMETWRKARDESKELSSEEQEELERFMEAELEASILRQEKRSVSSEK